MKKKVAMMLEWIRPAGIGLIVFFAYYFGRDAVAQFHIMGPLIVVLMMGTVAFESLFLGEIASEKIGYKPSRPYQIQSGLANAAIAVIALLVYWLDWGRYADATIVSVMLLFFLLSAANHLRTAIVDKNLKPVNLLRPVMALLLFGFLFPLMMRALA